MIHQRVQEANMIAAQGRWAEAAAIYEELIALEPFNLELREQFVIISFRHGDFRRVIEQYLDCAEILYMEGDWEAAIRRYEETLRLPEVIDGQNGPGAGDSIRRLVDSLKPDIYYQFGDYHLDRGYADLALQYLLKSDDMQSGRWETHMAIGQAYLLKGMDKEAIQAFQEVIRLAPQEAAVAYELMGEVFLRQRRPASSLLPWFRQAAESYYKKGQTRDAIRICRRILEFDPHNPETQQALNQLVALERTKA